MKRKIHAKRPTYCEQCGDWHADRCPTPEEIVARCEAERAAWTPQIQAARTIQRRGEVEVYQAGHGKGKRVEKRESGR